MRSTLILLLLIAALGAAVFFSREQEVAPASLTEDALGGRRLLDATRLTVRGSSGVAPIVLERREGYGFDVVEPLRDLASRARLLAMADAWDTAQLIRTWESDALDADLLVQLGLDDPRGELVAEYADRVLRFEIGAEGPLGEEVYVRRDGAVYQGSKALYSTLQGTADDFREHQVLHTALSSLRRLRVRRLRDDGSEAAVTLERRPGGLWLVEPIEARAHREAAAVFAASVLGLRVERFVLGNVEPRPRADYIIEVTGDAGSERVELTAQDNGMLLGHQTPRDLAFLVQASTYEPVLEYSVEQLRSKILNPHAPDHLVQIEVDPGAGRGRPLVLRRGSDQLFALHAPHRLRTDASSVARLLQVLGKLGVREFLPEPPDDLEALGLGAAATKVILTGQLRRERVEIEIGRDEGAQTYVRRAGEPHVGMIDAEQAKVLRRPWVHYVDTLVYEAPGVRDVRRVVYRRGDAAAIYTLDAAGRWVDGTGAEAAPSFAEVVERLTALHGKEVLERDSLGELGLATRVELGRADGSPLVRMELYDGDEAPLVVLPERMPDVAFRLGVLDRALLEPAPQ